MKNNRNEKNKEYRHKDFIKKKVKSVEKYNPPFVQFVAALLTIILIASTANAYFAPYIVSSTEIREYTSEDYLFIYNIYENPTYIMKTTETATIKPKTNFYPSNDILFELPTDCFNIQVTSSNQYDFDIDEVGKKITFYFLDKRSEIENIQLSYTYKQKKNPHIVLLDYQFAIKNSTIEEILVIENTENAKVTSYKGAWFVNNDDSGWLIKEKINNTPHRVFVQKEEIDFEASNTKLNNTEIILYSWDMDFNENEIKTVKIKTLTNLNYNWYDSTISLRKKQPALSPIFPYVPNTYEWACFVSVLENYSYVNETDYVDNYSIRGYIFPLNKSILEYNYGQYSKKGLTL